MGTNKSGQMNSMSPKFQRVISNIFSSSFWPFYLTGVIVLISEIFTAFMNIINSLIWWGRIDIDLLIIGCIDAMFVSLVATSIGIYFIKHVLEIQAVNRSLLQEIDERQRTEKELKKQAEELLALNTLGRDISNTISIEQICTAGLRGIFDAVHPDQAFLFLRQGERLILQDIQPQSAFQKMGEIPEHRVGECLCGLAAKYGKPLFSTDIFTDRRCTWDECKKDGFKSFAALPLHNADETIGVIGLASEAIQDFKEQSEFLETLSNQIAVSLANSRLIIALDQELAERKLAEDALRKSEERFKLALEATEEGLWDFDPRTGIAFFSPRWQSMLGYRPGELPPSFETWTNLLHPDDRTDAEDAVIKLLNHPEELFSIKFRMRTKSGGWCWIHSRGKAVEKDSAGNVSRIIGTHIDITERHQLEKAFQITQFSFDKASIGIYRIGSDAKILNVNEQGARQLCYSIEELTNISIYDINPFMNYENWNLVWQKLREKGVNEFETIHRRKDGVEIPVHITANLHEIDGHQFSIAFSKDISERKKLESQRSARLGRIQKQQSAQIELARNEFIVRGDLNKAESFIVETAANVVGVEKSGLWLFDDHKTELRCIDLFEITSGTHQNGAVLLVKDYPSYFSALSEERVIDVFHPLNDERLREIKNDYLAPQGITSMLDAPIRSRGQVIGVLCLEHVGNPRVWQDDEISFAASCADYVAETLANKERMRVEQDRRDSEFRFRSFFDSNPEGIMLMDFEGKITGVNRTLAKMGGYSIQEIVNRHFKEYIPLSYHDKAQVAINSIKAGIQLDNLPEIAYLTKDGGEIPISIRSWRITDEDSRPISLGVFVHDLTKEKQLAEEKAAVEKQLMQTQKLQAIGTLAGGIAHDFNNILGGIMGYTQLAMMEKETSLDKKQVYLSRVLTASNRAKDLVQQILRFSRHESTDMKPIGIAPIIIESIKLLRSTLPATIKIEQDFQENSAKIVGDPTQIHQVMMNLCTNAFHAMKERGGILTISMANVVLNTPKTFMDLNVPPGEYVKLSISDTGHGIAPHTLERIFDPYFTTKKVNEGTGLGLSVIMGIIKIHHGLINVESDLYHGTRFDVYFPLIQAETHKTSDKTPIVLLGNQEKILVVDDEPFFLDVVKDNLEMLKYKVSANLSSLKTLELFKENPTGFDLVITDQTMPEMTGIQLIAEIRNLNSDIPIILCTGYSENVSEHSAKYYSITKFLMKPVIFHDLALAVQEVLQKNG